MASLLYLGFQNSPSTLAQIQSTSNENVRKELLQYICMKKEKIKNKRPTLIYLTVDQLVVVLTLMNFVLLSSASLIEAQVMIKMC